MNQSHGCALLSVVMLVVLAACQAPQFTAFPSPTATALSSTVTAEPATITIPIPTYTSVPPPAETSTPVPTATMAPQPGGSENSDESHQWAAAASATSQLDDAHSAAQLVGDPGTEGCDFNGRDFNLQPNGWVSAGENTIETLTLSYAVPVVPTKINIHQVVLPNAVTKVDVVDVTGAQHTVYTGPPYDLDYCPYIMQLDVQDVSVKIQTAIITLDQSVLGKRNEINAVELVGKP